MIRHEIVFNSPSLVADSLSTPAATESSDQRRYVYEEGFVTVLLDPTDQEDMTVQGVVDGAVRFAAPTFAASADREMFLKRYGDMRPAVLVSPENDEDVGRWVDIHSVRSLHPLDNDRKNIAERLGNGGIIAVLGSAAIGRMEDRLAAEERKALAARSGELYEKWLEGRDANQLGPGGSAGLTRRGAMATFSEDWNGNLGGGSPQKPFRIPGMVHM